jgi:hypothetical protein
MTDEFDELVEDLAPGERARLQRAHDLLRAAGPMPELPPELEEPVKPPAADIIPYFPRRRWAAGAVAAAAAVAAAFGGGYLLGHRDPGGSFVAAKKVRMHATDAAPGALASIQIGKGDDNGNWPMVVKVSNLRALPPQAYYTVWLTRDGKPVAPCGTFRARGASTEVAFTVAYSLKRFDGWVVTVQTPADRKPGPIVLST